MAFNFGQPSTGSSTFGSLFGNTAQKTAASTFGGFGSTFQTPATTTQPALGFGTTTTAGTLGTTGFGVKPQQQLQLQQQQAAAAGSNDMTAMMRAVTMPLLFSDERDNVIMAWNRLQASFGTGKAFYTQAGASVDLRASNPLCKFKAAGYSVLPTSRDEDGLVSMIVKKGVDEVKKYQQQLVESLAKVFGSQQHLTVCVDRVTALPNNKTEVVMYLLQRGAGGATRRMSASEVSGYLVGAGPRAQLQQLGVSAVSPKVALSNTQLKHYLDTPPNGVDTVLWQQAKLDNPDPKTLIPVPVLGFAHLGRRHALQQDATAAHTARIQLVRDEVSELEGKLKQQRADIEQMKRATLARAHTLLKVVCGVELWRRQGQSASADEERLRCSLEAINNELQAPTHCKGRLREMLSLARLRHQTSAPPADSAVPADTFTHSDVIQHLRQELNSAEYLVQLVQEDMEDIKLLQQDRAKLAQQHPL